MFRFAVAMGFIVLAISGSLSANDESLAASESKTARDNPIRYKVAERFLILTANGPIVVEAAITIAGKPFREGCAELVDWMLAKADKNNDQVVTWSETIGSTAFNFGRLSYNQARAPIAKSFDKNRNDKVDRAEAHAFLASYFRGSSVMMLTANNDFSVAPNGTVTFNYGRVGRPMKIMGLLDSNKDDELTASEIVNSAELLESLDADDNDLLYPNELKSQGSLQVGSRARVFVPKQELSQVAVLLDSATGVRPLYRALTTQYQNTEGKIDANSFPLLPDLFVQLDRDKNGWMDEYEIIRFEKIKPHLELTIALGEEEDNRVKVTAFRKPLIDSSVGEVGVSVHLPNATLSFVANPQPATSTDYSANAESVIRTYDKNGNQYLEKNELHSTLLGQFELWDDNEDGKVYSTEIEAGYERQIGPLSTQVRVSAVNQGHCLFQHLDVSGDNRLSLLEMRESVQRLKELDENQDGALSGEEVPQKITFTFTQGNLAHRYRAQVVEANINVSVKSGPDWFHRMDRNRDGNVTIKEFLRKQSEFRKIDLNNDGFLASSEASRRVGDLENHRIVDRRGATVSIGEGEPFHAEATFRPACCKTHCVHIKNNAGVARFIQRHDNPTHHFVRIASWQSQRDTKRWPVK
jgi:Ca2+-binding EF-hand superfamily protein